MNTAALCASHSPLFHCYSQQPKDWDKIQAAYKKSVDFVKDFDPELVIAFGSDHFNGFFLKMMPSFCIGLQAEAADDIGGFPGKLDVPQETAVELIEYLRAHDIDPSVSYRMTIDHAFSQGIHDMLGGLDIIPVIPVFINCITPPFVPFRRSRMLGEAIGRFAAQLGKRVLFLGSGGMSHHPTRYYPAIGTGEPQVAAWQVSGGDDPQSLTASEWLERLDVMHHEGADMIIRGERTAEDMRLNAEADQRFLDVLTRGALTEFDQWKPLDVVEEAGVGSMELHTWIATTAAHMAAGGHSPEVDVYSVAPELGIAAGIVHAA